MLQMKVLTSLLAAAVIGAAHAQISSPTVLDSSSSQQTSGLGGTNIESQAFRDRFTRSPRLPGPPFPSTEDPFTPPPTNNNASSDDESAKDPSSGGLNGPNDASSQSIDGSSSEIHSVGSSDEDNSLEYDPAWNNHSVASETGSVMLINDETSASSSVDAGSGGIYTRPIALFTSLASGVMIAIALT